MRFTVTGEWDHNRLLQVVVVLYCFFVILLWFTNWMLYFDAMDLTTASVVDHYLDAQGAKQFDHRRNISQMRDIGDHHRSIGE